MTACRVGWDTVDLCPGCDVTTKHLTKTKYGAAVIEWMETFVYLARGVISEMMIAQYF